MRAEVTPGSEFNLYFVELTRGGLVQGGGWREGRIKLFVMRNAGNCVLCYI